MIAHGLYQFVIVIFLNPPALYQPLESKGDYYAFLLSFTLANIACSRIKKHNNIAVIIFAHELTSFPFDFTSVEIVPLISTPTREPRTFPTPPVKSVPPITEDEIASISKPVACVVVPHIVFKQ